MCHAIEFSMNLVEKGGCCNLSLGLMTKQRPVKVQTKCEALESHFMLPGVQESVR
jgi:hypothetical protein